MNDWKKVESNNKVNGLNIDHIDNESITNQRLNHIAIDDLIGLTEWIELNISKK